jgi:hypothetical protein
MSKLLTALLAAGFGLGLNAATALDIQADQSKVDRPEQTMQEKEQAASKAGTTNYATPSDTHSQSERSGNASTPAGSNEQVPPQSMPSVGHPKEGAVTGQFGVKKLDESGQLDQSTSGMSDQSSGNEPDKRITPN